MKLIYPLTVAVVLLLAVSYVAQVTADESTRNLETIIAGIDSRVREMRIKGESSATIPATISDLFRSTFSGFEDDFPELYGEIVTALGESLPEENIFALRNSILTMGAVSGVHLTFTRRYSLLMVFLISALVSLIVTLISKEKVNWKLVREYKAKISAFAKEEREAKMKGDRKRLIKLSERKPEIYRMQSEVMAQTMKPTLYYFVPLMILWFLLMRVFGNWVLAFLPFRLDLPFVGTVVTFGVEWWYFISYLACSSLFRALIIKEEV